MNQESGTNALQHQLDAFFGMSIQIMGIVFLSRLILDTGTRLLYPFIPQFSAGLGLTVVGFSWLIFFRAMAGIAGPIFGVWADRYGRRKIMATGLLFQAAAVIGLAFSWQWWATVPMILFGLSMAAFIPAGQAYISDQATFERRGRALGTIEFSWAVTGIIALPIIGWMIDAFGWRAPLFSLSLLSLIGSVMVWRRLPAVERRPDGLSSQPRLWEVCTRKNVMATVGVSLFLFVAIGSFITLWGIWLSADFGLSAVALGFVATAIGLAELIGSGLSALFIDRIGKRRGSMIGLLLLGAAFLLLPLSQYSLLAAVPALIALGICIEFTIVSLLPLYAEQAPEARATVFSLVGFGVAIGLASGSPISATLWSHYGLWAASLVAAAGVFVALSLTAWFLYEHPTTASVPEEAQVGDLVAR